MIAVIDMGAFLADPPKTRIFEANICLSYYREHDASAIGDDGSVPEQRCKIDAVQQKLAMIFGWQDTFEAILGRRCEVCEVPGAERSEYILGLGVAFVDLKDEARLSGGDLDWRDDLELLLLERRVLTMYGKRSFMRADTGVPIEGCDADEAWLRDDGTRGRLRIGVDPDRVEGLRT